MTTQQIADALLAQWQLLWPLPAAERRRRFAEIVADYEFEEALEAIREAIKEDM